MTPRDEETWADDVLATMSEHVVTEKAVLESYRRIARATTEPDVRYLLTLIAEEEERHHARMAQIVNAIRRDFRHEIFEPAVPDLSESPLPVDLAEATRQMLEIEEHDARDLQRLAAALKHAPKRTMWPLLVETMIADTDKHRAILRFLLDRAAEVAPGL